MSGRGRQQADPDAKRAAELAELRQVTRELHEAAQDARAAAKELRAAHDRIPALVDDVLGPYAEKELGGIADQIRKVEATITERLSKTENEVFDRMAEIATAASSRKQWLEDISELIDRSVNHPDYVGRVAAHVIGKLPARRQ